MGGPLNHQTRRPSLRLSARANALRKNEPEKLVGPCLACERRGGQNRPPFALVVGTFSTPWQTTTSMRNTTTRLHRQAGLRVLSRRAARARASCLTSSMPSSICRLWEPTLSAL